MGERSHGMAKALKRRADRPRKALIENQRPERAVPPFLVRPLGMDARMAGGLALGGRTGRGGGNGGFPRRGGALPTRDARSHTDWVSPGDGRVTRDRAQGAGASLSIRGGTGTGGLRV